MALIKDGYFQDTYWPSRYWQEDYWPEYGADVDEPSPAATETITTGGVAAHTPIFPLTLGLTLQGELVWVYPIKLKKESE